MSLNIHEFRSSVLKDDLARQNLFKVKIPNKIGKTLTQPSSKGGSKSILGSLVDVATKEVLARSEVMRRVSGFYSPEIIRALGLGDMLDKYLQYPYDLGMYVREVTLPGRVMAVDEFNGDQVPHHIVTGADYDPISIQFICTPSLKERQFFLDWTNLANGVGTNKFGFYDEYVSNITVNIYDRQGNLKSVCEIADAFPIRVSDMSLAYEANSQLAIFDVTFRFKNAFTKEGSGDSEGNLFDDARRWYDSLKRLNSTFRN